MVHVHVYLSDVFVCDITDIRFVFNQIFQDRKLQEAYQTMNTLRKSVLELQVLFCVLCTTSFMQKMQR